MRPFSNPFISSPSRFPNRRPQPLTCKSFLNKQIKVFHFLWKFISFKSLHKYITKFRAQNLIENLVRIKVLYNGSFHCIQVVKICKQLVRKRKYNDRLCLTNSKILLIPFYSTYTKVDFKVGVNLFYCD